MKILSTLLCIVIESCGLFLVCCNMGSYVGGFSDRQLYLYLQVTLHFVLTTHASDWCVVPTSPLLARTLVTTSVTFAPKQR